MARRVTGKSAFTLLEMLVALAIVSLIATALYASLRIGFDARARGEAAIAPTRAATAALDLLREDIESAPPPTGVLASAFIGQDAKAADNTQEADALAFNTAAEDVAASRPGIRKIEIALTVPAEGGDYVLVRRVTSNLLAPQTPQPVEETLCRSVVSFNLRYYDGSAWVDSWDSTQRDNALPMALEVMLAIRNPGSNVRTRVAAGQQDAGIYRVTRVFRLPCAVAPTDQGTTTVPTSST